MSIKDLIDNSVKEFDKEFTIASFTWNGDMHDGILFARQSKRKVKQFLSDQIQKAVEETRKENQMTKTKTNKRVDEGLYTLFNLGVKYEKTKDKDEADKIWFKAVKFYKKLITQTQQETLECAEKEIEKIFKDACLLNIDDDMKYWKRDKDNNSDADSKFFPQDLFDKVRQTIKQRKEEK